jgi:hypothetical protein
MEETVSTPNVYAHAPAASVINALQGAMPAGLDVWNTSSQPAMVFTYKFERSQPPDQWNVFLGWTAFTATQKAAVQSVLAEYESIVNVKFVATTSADPDINFGRVNMSSSEGGEGGYRYTYATTSAGLVNFKTLDGFAVFNNQAATIARNTILCPDPETSRQLRCRWQRFTRAVPAGRPGQQQIHCHVLLHGPRQRRPQPASRAL